ncbi:MAG: hypothetical protein N2557_04510 [Hydrogenophilus sp.]|nr:hypothetical protein [Hydrogenophilus sp.]
MAPIRENEKNLGARRRIAKGEEKTVWLGKGETLNPPPRAARAKGEEQHIAKERDEEEVPEG